MNKSQIKGVVTVKSPDDLASAIVDSLNEYSEEIQSAMYDLSVSVAKESAERLRTDRGTPAYKGNKYIKEWNVKDMSGMNFAKNVVHNRGRYRLTHLLEKGHKKRGSEDRTRAFVHIAPVEKWATETYEKQLKAYIEGKK